MDTVLYSLKDVCAKAYRRTLKNEQDAAALLSTLLGAGVTFQSGAVYLEYQDGVVNITFPITYREWLKLTGQQYKFGLVGKSR